MKLPRLSKPPAWLLFPLFLVLSVLYFSIERTLAQVPSAPSDTPILTGRVTSEVDGSPLANVRISLSDGFPYFPDITRTDSSGYYTVTASAILEGLPGFTDGAFYVGFSLDDFYVPEYYKDRDDNVAPTWVTLTLDSLISGIDASLALGGQVQGKVLSQNDTQPLGGTQITLYDLAGEAAAATGGIVDSNGNFTVSSVPPGTYTVHARPPQYSYYADTYYPDKPRPSEAESIEVTPGKVVNDVDISLIFGGQISGTVSSDTSPYFMSFRIEVYNDEGRLLPEPVGSYFYGFYLLTNLAPGSYRLRFVDPYQEHRSEYYDNQMSLDTATPVVVVAGQATTNIDAELTFTPTVVSIATSTALPNTILLTMAYDPVPIYTTNGGHAWQKAPTSPWAEHKPYDVPLIAVTPRTDPGLPQRMVVAARSGAFSIEHGLYRSGDLGHSWATQTFSIERCNLPNISFSNLVASPTDSKRLYLAIGCNSFETLGYAPYYNVLISRDSGITWQLPATRPEYTFGPAASSILPSPVMTDRVYASYGQTWEQSDDGGDSWSEKEFRILYLALDAQDAELLYGISPEEYDPRKPRLGKRSDDGGTNWVNWTQQPCELDPIWGNFETPPQLMAHPTQTRLLFLRCEAGLFRSDDAGDNWTQLASTPGQLLAPDYGTPGRILWGKDNGLWASTDNGTTWQAIMPHYELDAPTAKVPLYLPSVSTNE